MTTMSKVRDRVVKGRDGLVPVRDYLPVNPRGIPLLWVHGGAFTAGSLDQKESDAPARAWAAEGRWVRTVDYRLVLSKRARRANPDAPVNRFPAAHRDVVDAANALRECSGGPIFIGGASAGANLAAGIALALRDSGETYARGLVLAYGAFHATLPRNRAVERELRNPITRLLFNPWMTRQMNLNYVGDAGLLVPGYAFPGGADLTGLPPAIVVDARNDRLRCSSDLFADELRTASVPVEEHVLDSWHGFLDRPGRPAFTEGLTLVSRWLAHREREIADV